MGLIVVVPGGGIGRAPEHRARSRFLEDILGPRRVVGVIALHVALGDMGSVGHAWLLDCLPSGCCF